MLLVCVILISMVGMHMNSMLRLIKGPSIVACKTRSRKMCSGHNPKGWVGHGEARGSKTAFLFTKPSTNVDIIKLLKVGGPSLAQIDNPENGPSFGKWEKTSITLYAHTHASKSFFIFSL